MAPLCGIQNSNYEYVLLQTDISFTLISAMSLLFLTLIPMPLPLICFHPIAPPPAAIPLLPCCRDSRQSCSITWVIAMRGLRRQCTAITVGLPLLFITTKQVIVSFGQTFLSIGCGIFCAFRILKDLLVGYCDTRMEAELNCPQL